MNTSMKAPPAREKPFLGVLFECCNIYYRIYRNVSQDAYEGRCPRCLRKVVVRIDPSGQPGRFISAG